MSDQPDTVTINLDGKEVEVPAGMNIVDAAKLHGVEIPHYCYHPHLSIVGNCRMCLVEMGMPMKDRATGEPILDDDGKQKVGFFPKPAIACSTKAAPGMHIKTKSEKVKDCRNGVMEFLLVNHPLDCPICDQAGECSLQEFATDYGRGYSRFVEEKNVKPKRTRLGPRVTLDDERCILCSRCIRFSKEIDGKDVLGFIDRGSYSTLTCYPGKELDSNYSLNTVDICPVGALTSTDFRFKMRVWFLKPTKSICTESSVGVNTEVWSREGKIYRITPRRNDEVNDTWMSDSGRMLYKIVDSEDRLEKYCVDGSPKTLAETAAVAADLLKQGGVAYVGSGLMSLEEQYLLRQIVNKEPGAVYFISHRQEGDEKLISKDRRPNMRGGFVTGLLKDYPTKTLDDLSAKIDSGEIKTVFVYAEDLTKFGISEEQLKKVKVVYLGTHTNATAAKSEVCLPMLTVFERSGCFVNQQFRVQKFHKAVPGPSGVLPDIQSLAAIHSSLTGEKVTLPKLEEVWSVMAKDIPQLAGMSFKQLPDTGTLIDASKWDKVDFPEGATWHYEPKTAEAAAG